MFDQAGQAGHPLYPAWYRAGGRLQPVVTRPAGAGAWRWEDGSGLECDPSVAADCRVVWSEEPDCSLGAGLQSASRYCNTTEAPLLPTQHSVLCGGRTALEVVADHPDWAGREVESAGQPSLHQPLLQPRNLRLHVGDLTVRRISD